MCRSKINPFYWQERVVFGMRTRLLLSKQTPSARVRNVRNARHIVTFCRHKDHAGKPQHDVHVKTTLDFSDPRYNQEVNTS